MVIDTAFELAIAGGMEQVMVKAISGSYDLSSIVHPFYYIFGSN